MGMCHNDYTGLGKKIIDDCIYWEKLTGIDLHGPEYWPLEPWTAKVWKSAADAGKFLKAHAGEFMPASFVKRCIEELGVRRIQHGVRCIEDPEVVALIKDLDVTLDVCPISNVKLQVEGITKMSEHPIRELFDAGVRCTINSDDPFMFGNSLSEEYYALATDLNFTEKELEKIAQNGFDIAIKW
jgi:adenosine deaminase